MTDSNLGNQAISKLEHILNKVRFKQTVISLIELVALIVLLLILDQILISLSFYQSHQNILRGVLILIGSVAFVDAIFIYIKKIKRLSLENLVEHLNRKDKEFTESAQLLLKDNDQLNTLQKIQKNKNIDYLNKILDKEQGKANPLKPDVKIKAASYLVSMMFLLLIFLPSIQSGLISLEKNIINFNANTESKQSDSNQKLEQNNQSGSKYRQAKLLSAEVKIIPPTYTQLKSVVNHQLDIKALHNSQIKWQLTIEKPITDKASEQIVPTYYFIQSNNQKKPFKKNTQGLYELTIKAKKTELYRIGYYQGKQLISLSDSHSIQVDLDQPPKIRLIQPKQSLIEIAKDGKAEIELLASIKDDFGLSAIKILASVAKGSGEAVKFRDKAFNFEQSHYKNVDGQFYKHWHLSELDMEPGDEVYIKVVASDNRAPLSQQSQSSTLIVRWHDEDMVETVTEGLQIGFIAEYFRSQRQIIIETEALIADKADMQQEQIDQLSRSLGHSQSDLKQRYGQYLGDEFGGGEQDHSHDLTASLGTDAALSVAKGFGLADGYHGGEEGMGTSTTDIDSQNEEQHGDDDHQHGDEVASDHGSGMAEHHSSGLGQSDITGKAELIAQFAHNHGEMEVGPLSKIDPKSWMKLAVNEMWQAEMHLMLSQPKLALPFEYRAYQYFKQARKAERVYAKRLGFEPPPVDEGRRLSGELEDIKQQTISLSDIESTNKSVLIYKKAYQLLSQMQQKLILNKSELNCLIELKKQLLDLAKSRPVMLQYATKLEQIIFMSQSKNNLTEYETGTDARESKSKNKSESLYAYIEKSCSGCVDKIKRKLWQLLPEHKSQAAVNKKFNYWSEDKLQDYLLQLQVMKLSEGNK